MHRELTIVIRSEQNLPRIHQVDAEETTIGRSTANVICLPDLSVSRQHAVVFRMIDGFHVRDVGSRNGTLVNGELRRESAISDGTEIQIGKYVLRALFKPQSTDNAEWNSDVSTAVSPMPVARKTGASELNTAQSLTRAQKRVYDQLLNGYSEKEIAGILHLSIHTVRTHSGAIYAKLAVSSRAELLARCLIRPQLSESPGTKLV